MMLISTSRQRLHLQLKLPRVEDFKINLPLICSVRPLSFKLQNYLDMAVWFLSKVMEKE